MCSKIYCFSFVITAVAIFRVNARLSLFIDETCRYQDNACIEMVANNVAMKRLTEDESFLEAKSIDPTYVEKFEMSDHGLKLTFSDWYLKGFGKCQIINFNLNIEAFDLRFKMFCPSLVTYGNYVADGTLVTMPVKGDGPFNITMTDYNFNFIATIAIIPGTAGNNLLYIEDYSVTMYCRGMTFDFKNLFSGDQKKSEEIHKFANDSWKTIARFQQEEMFKPHLNKLIETTNKYIGVIPLDEMFTMDYENL